jgi:hypothetical protein
MELRTAAFTGASAIPGLGKLTEQLAQAERLIESSFELISRQSELVKRLQREGDDPVEARRLLAELKELLAIHFADRDRLRELARSEQRYRA